MNAGDSRQNDSTTPPAVPRQAGCPYCGEHVDADTLADHIEETHKRAELLKSMASFPDSHVQSVPPLVPHSELKGKTVPRRASADATTKPATTRRTRAPRAGSGSSKAPKVPEREYQLQVPAPNSPPFLTKADFERERAAKERPPTAPATSREA
jgi:hypothetical protein